MKVVSPTGNTRYPDVVVDCGRIRNDDLQAREPRVLFEVLSPSNRPSKQSQLFNDYQAIDSLECLVLIEQDLVEVQVFVRGQRFWPVRTLRDISEVILLPMLGTELPLTEVYERLGFDTAP
jgi:Uma2 family endonuclease